MKVSLVVIVFCVAVTAQAQSNSGDKTTVLPKNKGQQNYASGMVIHVKELVLKKDELAPGETLGQFIGTPTQLTLNNHLRDEGILRFWRGPVGYRAEGFLEAKTPGRYVFALDMFAEPVWLHLEPSNTGMEPLKGFVRCSAQLFVGDEKKALIDLPFDTTANNVLEYERFCGLSRQKSGGIDLRSKGIFPVVLWMSCFGERPLSARAERFARPPMCSDTYDEIFVASRSPGSEVALTLHIKRPETQSLIPATSTDLLHKTDKQPGS